MTAERHFGNPGYVNLARNVTREGRVFPSPWPKRLRVLVVLMALGAVIGLASGVAV